MPNIHSTATACGVMLSCVCACVFLPGITSLQEANMAFLPYESKVFTLDYTDVFEDFYSRDRVSAGHLSDRIADQLATVCAMMGEYPSVRYRK